MPIERQRLADDAGIVVEAPRPEAVTQDDNWTGPRLVTVARAKQSPDGRDGAQHCEVVDGHNVAENAFSPNTRTGAGDAHRLREPRIRVDAVDSRCALTDVEIIGIRARTEANSAAT